jgi:hypothetical protein
MLEAQARVSGLDGKNTPMATETKQRISVAHKGRPGPMKGLRHTAESNEKNRLAHIGFKLTDESKQKLRAGHRAWVERRHELRAEIKRTSA